MLENLIRKKLKTESQLLRETMAEFLGTFILIAFGCGSVAQNVLGEGNYGSFLSVNWAWGIAVAMGVWVSGGVSGGHINPAVTLTFAILGRTPWVKVIPYMIAQYLGAILASACVYGVYIDALNAYDNGTRYTVGDLATAGIWATYPGEWLSIGNGFGDLVFSTALLLLCVLAITDKYNTGAPPGMTPFCIGLVVAVIGMAFGMNCGYAINPARDLGPRLFTAMAGWPDTFTAYNSWAWVPVVATHVGAILGAFTYLLLVGIHTDEDEDDEFTLNTVNSEPQAHEKSGYHQDPESKF